MKGILLGIALILFGILFSLCMPDLNYVSMTFGVIGLAATMYSLLIRQE